MADAFSKRPATGTVLGGRFRLERVIGVGGMASVWLAQDEMLGRPVAVKILSEALADDRDYVVRFGREARTAASVSHSNLVDVFDFQASGPRPYLVMEYVEGGTLAELIERGDETLDPVRIARELLSALRSIHEAGIVHRDVKPENVLVGVGGRMRLTDFGIAHPTDATRLTQTGQVIGTARFLAPELHAGAAPTVRSDLYSLGVLLRECSPPHPPPELVELAAHLSRADPAARPGSAAAALAELEDTGSSPVTEVLSEAAPGTSLPRSDATEPRTAVPPPPVVPVEPARAAARRSFVHVSPTRVALVALAVLAALILAATVLDDESGRDAPLLGPAAKPDARGGGPGEDRGKRR